MSPPFDTSVLDAALQERRERLETQRLRILEIARQTLETLRVSHGIASAYIVGSLGRPDTWRADSDVDVAVGGCSAGVLDVMAALEDATGRQVDVIDLDRHPSADAFVRSGVKIYG